MSIASAMSLEMFSRPEREEIDRLASAPAPPAKWLRSDHAQIISRAWVEWHWRRGTDPLARVARGAIPKRLRTAVIDRDGFVCQICGGEVELGDIHLDHRHPVSLGGTTSLANLQVTHSTCNLRKGARI